MELVVCWHRRYFILQCFSKRLETYIISLDGKLKRDISEKRVSYTYPFISENSQTIVFCTFDLYVQTMDIYYATKQDQYQNDC